MKTSTEICSAARKIGEEKAVELIAKAGFDAWDFSMFDMVRFDWSKGEAVANDRHPLAGNEYLKFARRLKQIGLDNGIHCNQSHAPFPTNNKLIRSFLKRSIECTAEAGGNICIIHPNEPTLEGDVELYQELLPFAKEHGVKIATENMWSWDNEKDQASPIACSTAENFLAHMNAVNDPDFVACLDLGHAEMRGLNTSADEMIRTLGSHLQALHIHDNDRWHDSHQIPFSMQMDFSVIAKALHDMHYPGYYTLEADQYLKAYTEENIFEGICKLAEAAKKFEQMATAE